MPDRIASSCSCHITWQPGAAHTSVVAGCGAPWRPRYAARPAQRQDQSAGWALLSYPLCIEIEPRPNRDAAGEGVHAAWRLLRQSSGGLHARLLMCPFCVTRRSLPNKSRRLAACQQDALVADTVALAQHTHPKTTLYSLSFKCEASDLAGVRLQTSLPTCRVWNALDLFRLS